MLWEQTLDKLKALKLLGMLNGAKSQQEDQNYKSMDFEERLGFLVDEEYLDRENRRIKTRVRQAKMKQQACVEDVDYRVRRKLNKSQFMEMCQCKWIKEHKNLILTGPTGVGKSYLSCALGHRACLKNYRVLYSCAGLNFKCRVPESCLLSTF